MMLRISGYYGDEGPTLGLHYYISEERVGDRPMGDGAETHKSGCLALYCIIACSIQFVDMGWFCTVYMTRRVGKVGGGGGPLHVFYMPFACHYYTL